MKDFDWSLAIPLALNFVLGAICLVLREVFYLDLTSMILLALIFGLNAVGVPIFYYIKFARLRKNPRTKLLYHAISAGTAAVLNMVYWVLISFAENYCDWSVAFLFFVAPIATEVGIFVVVGLIDWFDAMRKFWKKAAFLCVCTLIVASIAVGVLWLMYEIFRSHYSYNRPVPPPVYQVPPSPPTPTPSLDWRSGMPWDVQQLIDADYTSPIEDAYYYFQRVNVSRPDAAGYDNDIILKINITPKIAEGEAYKVGTTLVYVFVNKNLETNFDPEWELNRFTKVANFRTIRDEYSSLSKVISILGTNAKQLQAIAKEDAKDIGDMDNQYYEIYAYRAENNGFDCIFRALSYAYPKYDYMTQLEYPYDYNRGEYYSEKAGEITYLYTVYNAESRRGGAELTKATITKYVFDGNKFIKED